MKILMLTNIPSPYRVDFFNELGKYCELTVLFEKKESDERDNSWKNFKAKHFTAVFLNGKRIGVAEAFCPGVICYLKKNTYDYIIVTNFSDITGIISILYMKSRKISYGIESDGGFAGTGRGIKEYIKRLLLSTASFYFSTAKKHDEYYTVYGAKKEQIIRYPFSSLHDSDILNQPVSAEEKNAIKKKLNINEEKVILSVGQFVYRKGYDVLLNALTDLDDNIGCYIVGGEPTEEYIKLIEKNNLKNIHFVSFKKKNELDEYYKAADLFVLPTREDIWGLVINEAMAKGLPVITTDKCIAGLELIDNRKIGRIVQSEDAASLSKAINEEISEISIQKSIGVLNRIRDYSIEKMAQVHISALERMKTNGKEKHFDILH